MRRIRLFYQSISIYQKNALLSYKDRKDLNVPKVPEGIAYKNLGTQESQNCSSITLRMKHRKFSWSIAGANSMAKTLVRIANKTIGSDIRHYKDAIIESDKSEAIWTVLSAAKSPKLDGKGNKTGKIQTGHVCYKDAKMSFK
ncbi:hypothetical protein LQZ18_05815 [Lachnospiraceae bacterium ZAX-1]